MSGTAPSRIDTDVLGYWGLACRRASIANHYCTAMLHDKGVIVTVVGPAGDSAEMPIVWSELGQVTERKGVIDEIIAALKRELKSRNLIITPDNWRM